MNDGERYSIVNLRSNVRQPQLNADAGADCLYAPRINSIEDIAAIIAAVAPKPVNLLINSPFITVDEAAALGVRRISVGVRSRGPRAGRSLKSQG